jgi:carbon-monoxide dehydrogenase large subunit
LAETILNIDKNKLRCITTDVGGGFGMKVFVYPEHALVTCRVTAYKVVQKQKS